MTTFRLAHGLLASALVAAPGVATAEDMVQPILEARLRYETVDQDGLAQTAQALTLRTRLGLQTAAWNGFRALVEGENVTALADDYNSTINGKAAYPVVADPEATELNRAQVGWTGAQGGVVVGRQRIVFANARFVGNVGFRQNEQTFDAVRFDYRPTKELSLSYAYLDRVRRVFGPDSAQGEWKGEGHLLQADAKTPAGQVSLYAQILDLDNAPAQSSATWGVRLTGARQIGPNLSLTYEAEAARQTDYAGNPADFDLGYIGLGGGLRTANRWASLGYERLDGDGRRGFQTPLATLHAFQGWADVFLTTPSGGVRDLNLRAGASAPLAGKVVKLTAAAHDFADADGGVQFGREVDAAILLPLDKRLSAELKAAQFDGDTPAFPDRTKIWLTLEFKL